ncbi:hypothetical protein AZE42_10168, partial [Rhizopogon vesiculosus]
MFPHRNGRPTTEFYRDMSGDDFWGDNTTRSPHRSAAPSTDSPRRRRNLFDFLRFS